MRDFLYWQTIQLGGCSMKGWDHPIDDKHRYSPMFSSARHLIMSVTLLMPCTWSMLEGTCFTSTYI